MAERLFIVSLNGAGDPMDRSNQQPVHASKVEVVDGYLVFTRSDGTLSAFFHPTMFRDWREADQSELDQYPDPDPSGHG